MRDRDSGRDTKKKILAPRRGEGTNARAEDPLKKTSFAGTTRQAKERQPLFVWKESERAHAVW